jgi:hypothetical protein
LAEHYYKILGKRAVKDIASDVQLELSAIEGGLEL